MISVKDRQILRELAKQVAEIADLPVMEERRSMWKRHNRLERVRPMVLVFPEGAWRELLPGSALRCEGENARGFEWDLRSRIYHYENIHDDKPIEKTWITPKIINNTRHPWGPDLDWGLEAKHVSSSQSTGAWGFDPVLKSREDLKKLKFPTVEYDEQSTQENHEKIQELFGDILQVKLKGVSHISFHFMSLYIHLRGLEQMMWDMYDEPEMVHEAMSFFEEGYRRVIRQYVDQNLLSLNNDETYHSSGGVGYSGELPKPGFNLERIRPCDMWASAESQEMAQVSPEMHEEFVMQYERRVLEPFGLNGYGCCEDLTRKLDNVFVIPNMRRISISPWANVDACAEKLQNKFIFSWKPQPAHLVGGFDEEAVRSYIKHTLDVSQGCVIEMILKDTHTCENHPERFTRWTQIARELVEGY
jgi:hypothetical protein